MKNPTWVAGNSDCGKWADMPPDFDEKLHFIQCCHCRGWMQSIGEKPSDYGYRDTQKVTAVLVLQSKVSG